MIKQELFIKTLKLLEDNDKKMDNLEKALKSINLDFCSLRGMTMSLTEHIITLLEDSMSLTKDEYCGTDISWWIYDTNFGKENPEIIIHYKTKDEKHILIDTAEKLYNYIKNKTLL